MARGVGALRACKTNQFVGSQVTAVEELWPDGPPPIEKICMHDAPSDQLKDNLAGRWYEVVHFHDGTRRVRQFVGAGPCADCRSPVDF